MKKNTDEKSLVSVNENSVLYKIKVFFKKLFHKKEPDISSTFEPEYTAELINNKRNLFINDLRKIENEETFIIDLQNKYRNKEIVEEGLTTEQINSLCELYDKQIAALRESNKIKRFKILEYKNAL